jgi:hypothetical protein
MAPVPLAKRSEPPLLRTKVDAQQTLWEAILPPELLRLPPGLEQVDCLLDDPVFFEPFVPFFHPTIGRPSIPMETYLRMMFLRFRYRLGFETLCDEVTDSLAWRRFCRIGITDAVPHPTTLMKITTRCGQPAVDGECSPTTPPRSPFSLKNEKQATVQRQPNDPKPPDHRAVIHHHRRTVPPDPFPASPVTPPVQKRPETGGENDRRGRGRASRGHSSVRHAGRRPCLHGVFQVEVINGGPRRRGTPLSSG